MAKKRCGKCQKVKPVDEFPTPASVAGRSTVVVPRLPRGGEPGVTGSATATA
jgi:hypothetical protein